jgi:hypothetical protein
MMRSGERRSGLRGVELGRGRDKAKRPTEKAGRSNRLGQRANGQERWGNPFSFSFPIFQSHFPKDFEFTFVFEVNHSVQKFKCSSMSAQSYI